MAGPARPDPPAGPLLRRALGYGAVAAGFTALSLLLLQLLVGRRLEQARIRTLGSEVAATVQLGEVALERFSPAAVAEIGGMRLVVGSRPEPDATAPPPPGGGGLRILATRLRAELCRRLRRCPVVWPATSGGRGVWVEMGSPLETVWLFVPLPTVRGWPPDPFLLSLGLAAGSLGTLLLFLSLEVQRPLRRLEEALAGVGPEAMPASLPARGSPAVRRLTERFNATVERLEQARRDRTTMLAGIAHDLRTPLTRLRLRLGLAAEGALGPEDRARSEADLASLERITRQFLLFAGAGAEEAPLLVPLDALLAETAALVGDDVALALDLEPLVRRVRPTALGRAVANLLENAVAHGRPPLRLVLRPGEGEGDFVIEVWDGGIGIPTEQWQRARQPFQRLDGSRGGQGHAGLGLAIAERVARDHLGGLEMRREDSGPGGPGGFAVVLRGRSLPDR